MILPNLVMVIRSNCCLSEAASDTFKNCLDKKRFIEYPDKVEYRYNSRGFRDVEWPADLQSAIWCIGDSATTGIGTSFENTWPQKLSLVTGKRVINISMEGASNNWIARRAKEISEYINPKNIIVQWTFVERREKLLDETLNEFFQNFYNDIKDPSWPQCPPVEQFNTLPLPIRQELIENHSLSKYLKIADNLESVSIINLDELRATQIIAEESDHMNNFKNCVESIKNIGSNLIYIFIPTFAKKELQHDYIKLCLPDQTVVIYKKFDLARDSWHFDKITSQWIAEQTSPLLK